MSHDLPKPRTRHMPEMGNLANRLEERAQELEAESGCDERRRHQRWSFHEANVPFLVEHPGGGMSRALVHTRNLSAHGVSVLHEGFLHPGSACRIILRRRDGELTAVAGEIRICRHVNHAVHELGISFAHGIDPTAYLTLDQPDRDADIEDVEPADLRGRVLYVDEFAADRRLLSHHLGGTNIRLTLAESPTQGLELAQRETFEIVLVDLNVAGGGVELIRGLRGQGFPGAIVAVSAETDASLLKQARDAGSTIHLPKPITAGQLILVMTKLHRQLGAAISPRCIRSALEDQPDMSELIEAFIEDVRAVAGSIDEALRAGDLPLVRSRCLGLKGSAEGHGFTQLGAVAGDAVRAVDATGSVNESAMAVRRLTLLAETIATGRREMKRDARSAPEGRNAA